MQFVDAAKDEVGIGWRETREASPGLRWPGIKVTSVSSLSPSSGGSGRFAFPTPASALAVHQSRLGRHKRGIADVAGLPVIALYRCRTDARQSHRRRVRSRDPAALLGLTPPSRSILRDVNVVTPRVRASNTTLISALRHT